VTQANLDVVFDHVHARRTRDLVMLESQLDPDVVHQRVLPDLRFSEVPWAPLNGQIYVVYTLRDGRIVRIDDYLSRGDAMAAAGAAVKDWV
jgi:hypothetical protein